MCFYVRITNVLLNVWRPFLIEKIVIIEATISFVVCVMQIK
jgi:hypothetical protein